MSVAVLWRLREGMVDLDGAQLVEPVHLVAVQLILVRVAVADVQVSRRELATCANLGGALLDETAEGCKASACSDHDNRHLFSLRGQVEGLMGRLDSDVDHV